MGANRTYKNSVFVSYFAEAEKLRELYAAVTGESVPNDATVDINTLENILVIDKLNDISFTLAEKQIVLIEAQLCKALHN